MVPAHHCNAFWKGLRTLKPILPSNPSDLPVNTNEIQTVNDHVSRAFFTYFFLLLIFLRVSIYIWQMGFLDIVGNDEVVDSYQKFYSKNSMSKISLTFYKLRIIWNKVSI